MVIARVALGKAIPLSFAAAFLVILFVGAVLVDAARGAHRAARRTAATQEVLHQLGKARESFARVDSAQRGYLLTGSTQFLQERSRWADNLHAALDMLQLQLQDSGLERDVAALAAVAQERLAVAQTTERTREAAGMAAGMAAVPVGQLERGLELSRAFFQQAGALQQQHSQLLAQQQAVELDRQQRTYWVVAAAFALFLLVLAPAYAGIAWQARRRRVAERRMRELVEQLPLTVWQLRTGGGQPARFVYLSGRAARDRGLEPEELLRDAASLQRNLPQADEGELARAERAASEQRDAFDGEYQVRMPDGGLHWIRAAAAARRLPDGGLAWTGYWADISTQKELEAALQAATDEANRANRAKGTFLATMSHEIRTPMNGVLGLLELLSLTPMDADQRATLAVVSESGRALLRIIDDILDFSKVEAGRLALHPVPASVAEVVERACHIHCGLASSRGLLLERDIDPRISPVLVFDPVRLGQILNNLISNALKFTLQGGVKVSVVSLSRDATHERLRFSVADTGIGISGQAAAGLFEPFAQAESGTSSRFGGTGLGLSICRRLAELMGGEVTLRSEEGVGTTAVLELGLPLAAEGEQPLAEAQEAPRRTLAHTVTARRVAPSAAEAEAEHRLVLVVDDHPTNRLVLARQVAALGYGLLAAENGVEALELWREHRVGLLLTDCNMPELDGYALARAIRAEEARSGRPRTPIVACTANALGTEAARCIGAGMDDLLVKPVDLVELMGRLDQWLPLPGTEDLPDTAAPQTLAASEALRALGGSNPAVLRQILGDFLRVHRTDLALLRQELARGDLEQVQQLAHRMRGAASVVGAQLLCLACEALEEAARARDPQAVAAALAAAARETESLAGHVEGAAARDRDASVPEATP